MFRTLITLSGKCNQQLHECHNGRDSYCESVEIIDCGYSLAHCLGWASLSKNFGSKIHCSRCKIRYFRVFQKRCRTTMLWLTEYHTYNIFVQCGTCVRCESWSFWKLQLLQRSAYDCPALGPIKPLTLPSHWTKTLHKSQCTVRLRQHLRGHVYAEFQIRRVSPIVRFLYTRCHR
jgi:hypothetical protein